MTKHAVIIRRLLTLTTASWAGVFLPACGGPRMSQWMDDSNVAPVAEEAPRICVSLEGNGENFSSHFAAFTALLERGLEPSVIAGGSSGAPVAAIVRMLLQNPSIQQSNGDLANTRAARRSALVLGSSVSVFESLLFLPALDDFTGAIAAMGLQGAALAGNLGFVSNPDHAFAHAEAITAQLVMAAGFFAHHDFTKVLAAKSFEDRVALVRQEYIESMGLLSVDPKTFVAALFTPPQRAVTQETASLHREIRRRYFFMFNSQIPRETRKPPSERWQNFETFLSRHNFLLTDAVRRKAESDYFKTIDAIRPLPFIGALAATVGKTFLLPSPEVMEHALNSRDAQGRKLTLPEGALIHTTVRLGEARNAMPLENTLFPRRRYDSIVPLDGNKRIDDKPGFPSLYQFYFATERMASDLHAGRMRQSGHLLSFVDSSSQAASSPSPVLETSEHAQVFSGLDLQQALTSTISEPGVFRRIPLALRDLRPPPSATLPAALQGHDTFVVTYGGWLDTSANQTMSLMPDCDPTQIDHFVVLHPNRLTNDFQRNALRDTNFRASNADKRDIDGAVVSRLAQYLTQSRAVRARKANIDFNWNWDVPLAATAEADPRNRILKQTRPLYFFAAYQAYRRILEARTDVPRASSVFGDNVANSDLLSEWLSGTPSNDLSQRIYGSALATQ
jgi:hypothetical protein